MKRLVIARHAKSSWNSPAQDDFDRPLNERGLRDVPLAATRLAGILGQESVYMECSPAERAKTTSLALKDELNVEKLDWNESLYLCSPDTWLESIRLWDDSCATGITVGHNPGATFMVNRLTPSHVDNMPTCALALIEFEVSHWKEVDWGLGKLAWLDYPKMHHA